MFALSIFVAAECREVPYQGSLSGAHQGLTMRAHVPDAGIVAADELLAVNGKLVQDMTLVQWRKEWAGPDLPAHRRVLVTVKRAGFEIKLPVSPDARASVEAAFPPIRSFQCENKRGELSTVSFTQESETHAYVQAEGAPWLRLGKRPGDRFAIGILAGQAYVTALEPLKPAPELEYSQHSSEAPAPAPPASIPDDGDRDEGHGWNLAAGGQGAFPLFTVPDGGSVYSTHVRGLAWIAQVGLGHDHRRGRLRTYVETGFTGFGAGSGLVGGRVVYQLKGSTSWLIGLGAGYERFLAKDYAAPNGLAVSAEYSFLLGGERAELVVNLCYLRSLADSGAARADNTSTAVIGLGARYELYASRHPR